MEEGDKPLQYALYLLSFRPRSRKELEVRLQKKFGGIDIGKIIKKLEEWGYINDEEFARTWIEERLAHNPKGKFVLWKELREKGVEERIIEKMLQRLYPPEREREEAQRLAIKKWEREKDVEERKRRERTYRYLLSHGFSLEMAREMVETLSGE